MNTFRRNISLGFILLAVSIITLLTGCSPKTPTTTPDNTEPKTIGKYPMEITDGAGTKIIFDKKPERIISTAPSHTEILFGLGLGDKIVGVTTYCDYPEEAKSKEKIGDLFTPNVEKIIELQPDAVLNSWAISKEMKKQLESAGIKVITYNPETINQVINTINEIGKWTDTENEASKIVENMKMKQKEITDKIAGANKPKVFYEIEYSSALWTVGAGSFIDELITLSGGENVAKDASGAYAEYSLEKMIEKNPEIYITNTFNSVIKGIEDVKGRPGYENIDAMKNNRLEVLDGNLLSRPSQRVVEALELMAKAIHPELFK